MSPELELPKDHKPMSSLRYPELNLFDTRAQQKQAVIEAAREFRVGPANRKIWIQVAAVAVVFCLSYYLPVQKILPLPLWAILLVLPVLTYVILELRFRKFFVEVIRKNLRHQLVGQGIPVCLNCGCDLRGQTEPTCRECGKEFDPELLKKRVLVQGT